MGYGKNNYEKQTQQAEKIKRANFFALSCEWDLNITVGRLPDAHENYYKGYFGKSQTILQRKRKLKVHFQKTGYPFRLQRQKKKDGNRNGSARCSIVQYAETKATRKGLSF